MDEVLAAFCQHTNDLGIPYNHQWHDPQETWTKETWDGEAQKVKAMHTPGFWYAIPMMPGAWKLWGLAHHLDDVAVLTAKPRDDSPTFIGYEKLQWVRDFLGPLADNRFICCTRAEKTQYAPNNILVDDDPRTCKSWDGAGGRAVRYLNAEQAMTELATLEGIKNV